MLFTSVKQVVLNVFHTFEHFLSMAEYSQPVIPILQAIALIAPSLYTGTSSTRIYQDCADTLAGLTFTYSHVVIPPMVTHAPPKLLAKQWLQAYQFAPAFVAPLIILGTSSNALLSYLTNGSTSHVPVLYATAAVLTAAIIPYTALYMEPSVNGAGKWKAQELLRGEFELRDVGPGTNRDTARVSWKSWAETVDMRTIAELWAKTNAWRYVITGVAIMISATATVTTV
jgi:hypothetical protein